MQKDNLNDKLAGLEAMLFIHGEPISYRRIAPILGFEEKEIPALAEELKKRLWERADSGLALIRDEDKVQLMTKPQFHKLLENFVKDQLSEDLTPASLETLAIIAYAGPISRARIEYQRGVNSIFILRNLMLRGLVERFPNPEH
ncbi:MAG: SMC-Scp complex subunit ScpB, partial [Candidatus Liptonbacteria bacterium]